MRGRYVLACAMAMCLAALHAAAPAGETVPVDLGIVAPSGEVNRVTLTLSATGLGMTKDDTDTATVSGNVLANLTVDINAGTRAAIVSGLEFTGGQYTFSDVHFVLNYGVLAGKLIADGYGVGGTLDTPAPPGGVANGQFAAADHEAIIKRGTVEVTGTMGIGALLDSVTIDLADDPIAATSAGVGALVVSPPVIVGDVGTYQVQLDLPVNFADQIYDEYEGITARAAGSGLFRAEGSFTRVLPRLGDLDGNGVVNARDIDLLRDHIPSSEPSYDLSGDGPVNQGDMDTMIFDVLATRYGDADLDGCVDYRDYITLKRSCAAGGAAGWAGGDFSGDGKLGFADLAMLRSGFGFSGGAAAPVPEPSAVLLLGPLLLAIRRRRRARGPTA